jgi:DNA (cytosine-5)-methyltransferase 1
MKPTVLSLFSGIGGLDLGLEAAGCEIVGSVELDEAARASLRKNRSWPQLTPHDITEFAVGELALKDVDIIAGAPPCQPFSKAAQWHSANRAGLDDDRGLLVFSVLDLVARLSPKVVVLENVQGFIRGPTSVLGPLRDALPEIESETGHEYELDYRILDAHEYGVPQRRKRAIIVLSRVGDIQWPEPSPEADRPVAWDALGEIDAAMPPPKAQGKWAGLLRSIPEGENYQWHTNRGGGQPLFGYRTRYWQFLLKLAKDRPAWTIAAHPGPSTGPFHWDSRPLTPGEMLRLQGFPADWVVTGDRRSQVRQIGNATPPPLAEAIGRSIMELLGQKPKKPSLAVRRIGEIPAARAPQAVPARFVALADDEIPDHPGPGRGPAPRALLSTPGGSPSDPKES